MITGLAAAFVVGAAVLFMLLPMIQGREAPLDRAEVEPDEVRSQRRVLLRAIRDADYDFATGKLDDDDYRALKTELTKETLQLLDEAAEAAEDSDVAGSALGKAGGGVSDRDQCPSCNARVQRGTRFCTECGVGLTNAESRARAPGGRSRYRGEPGRSV